MYGSNQATLSNCTFPGTHFIELCAHTSTRPKLSKTTPPYYPSFTPVRQIRGSRLSFITFVTRVFCISAQHVYSFSLPVFPLFCFRKNEPPSSWLRPSQVIQSLRLRDCSLHLTCWLRLPVSSFCGPMFHSASHKPIKLHCDSLTFRPTTSFLPHVHPFGCSYWLELSSDPQFPVVPEYPTSR